MPDVVVREYARLTTAPVHPASLDEAHVTESAFEWLCVESARLRQSGAALVQLESRRLLRLDNYVGVIQTPCGTRIEILPKSMDDTDDADAARGLLRKILAECLSVESRESAPTNIQAFDLPLTEWVIREFLHRLDALVKRGIRFDYHAVREEQRFLRGRLDLNRQVRQPPGRQHVFQIEHDVFDADRPENRLIRSSLDRVCSMTRDADNWRLSHELSVYLSEIPASQKVASDFRRWRNDRLMAHYKPVRPWCALILGDQTPLSILGEWHGNSLLFPMEKLFERYVEYALRRSIPADAVLTCGPRRHHLVTHEGEPWFLLKPDFVLEHGGRSWVLDTKWKVLQEGMANRGEKYGMNQSDVYQLFAYGERYLGATGDLMLVYPRTRSFRHALPPFAFSDRLTLWVVPFDLETARLMNDVIPMGLNFAR